MATLNLCPTQRLLVANIFLSRFITTMITAIRQHTPPTTPTTIPTMTPVDMPDFVGFGAVALTFVGAVVGSAVLTTTDVVPTFLREDDTDTEDRTTDPCCAAVVDSLLVKFPLETACVSFLVRALLEVATAALSPTTVKRTRT